MGEPGLVLGLTGADTGLEGRCWGPLEKNPLEGLPELQGLSTWGETDKWMGHSEHRHSDLSPELMSLPTSSITRLLLVAPCPRNSPELLYKRRWPPRGLEESTSPEDAPATGSSAPPRGPLTSVPAL